jgi:hypothetical protein
MKKTYETPKLTVHGNVAALTRMIMKGGSAESGQSTGGGTSGTLP